MRRAEVLSRVAEGKLGVGNAAEMLEVSYRQAKRWGKRDREEESREGWCTTARQSRNQNTHKVSEDGNPKPQNPNPKQTPNPKFQFPKGRF